MTSNVSVLHGTRWMLHGLQSRPELNGNIVQVVSDQLTDDRLVVQLSKQRLRVRLTNMHSIDDKAVSPTTFLDALHHIRKNDDFSEFSTRLDTGDHEGALASAAKWTLKTISDS